jgi:hypothetical protein
MVSHCVRAIGAYDLCCSFCLQTAVEIPVKLLSSAVLLFCLSPALQNGTVVDPFAANPAHGALQQTGARVVTSSSLSSSSSSSKQQKQQPVNALAAVSAASMARFSSRSAVQDFAVQPLPKTYRKLQVVKLSVNFSEAVQCVQVPMPLPKQLPAGGFLGGGAAQLAAVMSTAAGTLSCGVRACWVYSVLLQCACSASQPGGSLYGIT